MWFLSWWINTYLLSILVSYRNAFIYIYKYSFASTAQKFAPHHTQLTLFLGSCLRFSHSTTMVDKCLINVSNEFKTEKTCHNS